MTNIFEDVKGYVTVKSVAEFYGIKLGRYGMVCCPFHDDKHPSMKIDDHHYYCFGCGAHGDAIGYVAQMFRLSQYNAACKIVNDFHLPIEVDHEISEEEKRMYKKFMEQKKYQDRVKKKFDLWKQNSIDQLCESLGFIREVKAFYDDKPGLVLNSNGLSYVCNKEPIVDYWIDILCFGTLEERREFFETEGKEVGRIAANIRRTRDDVIGKSGKCAR